MEDRNKIIHSECIPNHKTLLLLGENRWKADFIRLDIDLSTTYVSLTLHATIINYNSWILCYL